MFGGNAQIVLVWLVQCIAVTEERYDHPGETQALGQVDFNDINDGVPMRLHTKCAIHNLCLPSRLRISICARPSRNVTCRQWPSAPGKLSHNTSPTGFGQLLKQYVQHLRAHMCCSTPLHPCRMHASGTATVSRHSRSCLCCGHTKAGSTAQTAAPSRGRPPRARG
mmetsp:Transcript_72895/g.118243  ORF Transcript_72895/g.118243 Transcript_72895/m.118243 type:complete len:166 (-) Transcript_72895:595-1092(-)